jgi:hypothetical protein
VTAISYLGGSEWPAFPAVRVQLRGTFGLRPVTSWGKIDTGASRTVVPVNVLKEIGAYRCPRQSVGCKGYYGTTHLLPVYEVNLSVDDSRWPDGVADSFPGLLVIGVGRDDDGSAGGEDCEVLLGRDILSAWHLHLDGRNSHYTVT